MPSFASDNSSIEHTTRVGQVGIYLGKFFRMFVNEKSWKVFPMAAVVAAIVSSVCNNVFVNMEGTQIGALAFACVCVWNGFFNSIQTVCKERLIIKREHRAGLHISSYIVAHMIYQAFLCFVQTIICLIIYRLTGIPYPTESCVTGSFLLDFGITLFLTTYAADMLALCCSCIVKTTTAAMTVVPFLMIIQLIFSDVAFPLSGISETISDFTIAKWGIRTICTVANYNEMPSVTLKAAFNKIAKVKNQYKDDKDLYDLITDGLKAFYDSDAWEMLGEASQKDRQSEDYTFDVQNVRNEWLVLGGMGIVYAVIGTAFLENIDKDTR